MVVDDHAVAPEVRPDADYGVRIDWILRYCVQGTFISDHCWMNFLKFVFPCSLTGFLENHVVTELISFNVYEGGGTLLLPLQLAPLAIAVVLILTTSSPLFPWD